MAIDPRDMLEILPTWEEIREKYEGRRMMVIYYGHNHPTIETTIAILKEVTKDGIELDNGIDAAPSGSYFLARGKLGWHSSWIPWDGYAKILSIIDLENEEVIFTRAWDKFMVKDAFKNFKGKSWAVVKQYWIDKVEQMKADFRRFSLRKKSDNDE